MRDLQTIYLHKTGDQDGSRVAGSITLGGVIGLAGFGNPGYFVAEDVQQALGQADVIRNGHGSVLLQQQGAETRTAGDDAIGGVNDVNVVQEGDIKQILLAGLLYKI